MKQGLLSNKFFFFLLLMPVCIGTQAQVIADFSGPDTVNVGQPVNLTNLSVGATTYYWSFCSGSLNVNPVGTNLGNIFGNLDVPTYITLVKDGDKCYSFISNQGYMITGDVPHVTRNYLGNSFLNYPVSSDNLNGSGLFNTIMEGIQVKKDNGTWYGFVNNENSVVRLVFGSSLSNSPVASVLNITGLDLPHGMWIGQEGNTWIGFITCTDGNKLVRLNFGTSLANDPTVEDMGTLGGLLSQPSAIVVINDNGIYRMFASGSAATLVRLDFGTSLLNWPTGVNLGNFSGDMDNGGLVSALQDCETTTGFMTKYLEPYESQDLFWRINFAGGYTGTITMQSLGNIGDLDRPHSMSEIIREGDQLVAYITNRGTYTLTKLVWPMCSNASIPSSTLFIPPAFSYDLPGTYHISLTVDEGLQTKSIKCKQIVVVACRPPESHFYYTTEYPQYLFHDTSNVSGFISRMWEFGDGNTSTDPDPVHVYTEEGTYLACLTVVDSCGESFSCDSVYVYQLLTHYSQNIVPGTDLEVQFRIETPDATSWYWDFGDGSTSTEKDPLHMFGDYGKYKIKLTVSNVTLQNSISQQLTLLANYQGDWREQVTLYPNPSNGTFFIGVKSDVGEAELSVIDMSGKVIVHKNIPFISASEPVQTNLSNITPGVYLVNLRFDGTEKMWKMVVK
jgi:PKD repeat protein